MINLMSRNLLNSHSCFSPAGYIYCSKIHSIYLPIPIPDHVYDDSVMDFSALFLFMFTLHSFYMFVPYYVSQLHINTATDSTKLFYVQCFQLNIFMVLSPHSSEFISCERYIDSNGRRMRCDFEMLETTLVRDGGVCVMDTCEG